MPGALHAVFARGSLITEPSSRLKARDASECHPERSEGSALLSSRPERRRFFWRPVLGRGVAQWRDPGLISTRLQIDGIR